MEEIQSTKMDVRGVDCASCVVTIEKSVSGLSGVEDVKVGFVDGVLEVDYDPEKISAGKIAESVRSLGYTVGEKDRQVSVLTVEGLDCADEEKVIRKSLEKLEGVHRVDFDLVYGRLTVEHSLSSHAVIGAVSEAGFKAEVDRAETKPGMRDDIKKGVYLTAGAGLLTAMGFSLEIMGMMDRFSVPFYAAAMLLAGLPMAKKGFNALRLFSLDINFLMTLAVLGAAVIGEWLEGAVVVSLFSVAELLEAGSLERARRAIQSLMELAPTQARVVNDDGSYEEVPVEEVAVGTSLSVRPGERVPLDGEVIEGRGVVNQAPITGESMPVMKTVGDVLYAGSINGDGSLVLRVTRSSSDTTISRIVKLVEEARRDKAPSERFVDRFARYYTPLVVAASAAMVAVPTLAFGGDFSTWFYRGLVLLVIACPCALVISTPVTIVSGLARAAKSGVLIKGGNYLEALAGVDTVLFDKTGTLTEGRPGVVSVKPMDSLSGDELLRLAAAVESASEHPVAKAVVREAQDRGLEFEVGSTLHNHPGMGAHAEVGGRQVYVGNHTFFEESGLCSDEIEEVIEGFEVEGRTAVMVWEAHKALGILAVEDVIRKEARDAVERLYSMGVNHIMLLTGDNRRTAASMSRHAGIREFEGELLPEQKMTYVEELTRSGARTAMVGDGINDTPALAAATVGIAMGGGGSDQALETADVALMADDLMKLPYAVGLAKKSLNIVKWNIGFALALKAVFMTLAPMGYATLWMAVGADMGASILVILNGLRVLGYAPEQQRNR